MNEKQVTMKYILTRWRLVFVSVIIFALIAFITSVLMPAKYQSDISVIVVQKQANEKVDAFSATKSAEFLSNIFTRVIYTTSFFNDVQNAPFDVRRDFSHDPEEWEKEWKKVINVKKVNNTGIIHISVLDESRKTAEETAKAAAYILTTKSDQYHGGGERVTVRLIDGPNTPLRPTVPRIAPNTVVGGIFGGIIAIVFVYFFPNKLCLKDKKKQKQQNVEKNDKKEKAVENHFNSTLSSAIVFDEGVEIENEKEEEYNFIDEQENQNDEYKSSEINDLHSRISNFNKNK